MNVVYLRRTSLFLPPAIHTCKKSEISAIVAKNARDPYIFVIVLYPKTNRLNLNILGSRMQSAV